MPPERLTHPRFATVERTILKHGLELCRRYGAHHVGISKKYVGGKRLTDTSITFYVMRKGPDHGAESIPPTLELDYKDGRSLGLIATDVCEIGEQPIAFSVRGGNAMLGSHNRPGTVGLVFRSNGRDFLVTNAHVVTDPGVVPGLVSVRLPNGGSAMGRVITINDLTPQVLTSDAACVELAAGTVSSRMFRGIEIAMTGVSDFTLNDTRKFLFVSKEFIHAARWSAMVPGRAEITIAGQQKFCMNFHKLRLTHGSVGEGNSGSVVFCETQAGLLAVGLLFGGVSSLNEAWVFPIRRCLESVGVSAAFNLI